ncbi:hypothetical protein LU290_03415 [Moraxella nasibovis]|uniref:hypothetical protein n=1 Tax=Moraxella nasibovis TaxID=2904120 RepID=UPI002410319C|nr:hypothetical protein [Moraxella nasibovis]WFF39284.1 hypothetical protein LU290_03415 [Moraxella nasibovis]
MTTETQETKQETQEITAEQFSELQAEVERLRKHNETLLSEKKTETEKRKAEQAEKDRLAEETARKKGDFETLEAQYQDKIAKLEKQLADQVAERNQDLIKSQSLKIASQLSSNPHNQEILQMLIEKRLVAENGAVKVTDGNGNVTISTLDDLVKEFKDGGKYDSLVDGTGASGTGSTGQAVKTAKDYTEAERVALATSNPNLFNQLFS